MMDIEARVGVCVECVYGVGVLLYCVVVGSDL